MEKKNNLFDEHIEKQLDSLRKERQAGGKEEKKTVPTLIGGVIAAIFIISVVMRFVL